MAYWRHIFLYPWYKVTVGTLPVVITVGFEIYEGCNEVNIPQNIQQIPSGFGDRYAEFDPFREEGLVFFVPQLIGATNVCEKRM